MKKLRLPSEIVYLLSLVLISLAVAMVTASDLGISMVVAPAYLLSLKVGFLSFGVAEYVIQGLVFLIFCLLKRKVRLVYFGAFLTCVIYGGMLDLWRLVPLFDPSVTPVGSMGTPLRIVLFGCGMLLTSFSVALSFKTYLYPQVYDFFVKDIGGKFGNKRFLFKVGFDLTFLAVALVMSFAFFGEIRGIGVGTIIMAFLNGFIIGFFDRFFDKTLHVSPLFGKIEKIFAEKKEPAEKERGLGLAACESADDKESADINNPTTE